MRVINLANDDVCYQDGGNSYVHGYSAGAQKHWLEGELARTRADADIDWIVVCMHQTAVSTGDRTNGADLGIREDWLPLFDRYGVESGGVRPLASLRRDPHPIRGILPTDTLTPAPAGLHQQRVDTSKGTVHLVIGGGGTSIPSHGMFFADPRCRVLMEVGDVDPATGHRTPHYVEEHAVVGLSRHGQPVRLRRIRRRPGNPGRSHVDSGTYYAVNGFLGAAVPVDSFTLTRPRRD